MRIAAIAARTIRWSIAGRGAARGRSERAAVLLEVRTSGGAIGLGEAAPLPGMSRDTFDAAIAAIAAFVSSQPPVVGDVARAIELATRAGAGSPAARFAIETALLDALARERGVSLARLITAHSRERDAPDGPTPTAGVDRDPRDVPVRSAGADRDLSAVPARAAGGERGVSAVSVAAAGADRELSAMPVGATGADRDLSAVAARAAGADRNLSAVPARAAGADRDLRSTLPLAAVVDDAGTARAALASGIRCLKIKLGGSDDLDRVRAIAAAAPGAALRLDANRAWSIADARHRLAALAALELPIAYVEEPCRDAERLLDEALPLRLALDESLGELTPAQLDRALHSPGLAALVLKPTLLGGLAVVRALAVRAHAAGIAAVVTHGLEGPIGTAACAETAFAIADQLGISPPVGLAPHPALDAWRLTVPQLAHDHVCRATHAGLGFAAIDLATALAACDAISSELLTERRR